MYVDHAATTPISAPALAALTRELSRSGNPSSLHGSGRRARRSVEEARETIAAAAGAHASEVVFTSGGTEASNLAIKGAAWAGKARGHRIVTSAVEHHAVVRGARPGDLEPVGLADDADVDLVPHLVADLGTPALGGEEQPALLAELVGLVGLHRGGQQRDVDAAGRGETQVS